MRNHNVVMVAIVIFLSFLFSACQNEPNSVVQKDHNLSDIAEPCQPILDQVSQSTPDERQALLSEYGMCISNELQNSETENGESRSSTEDADDDFDDEDFGDCEDFDDDEDWNYDEDYSCEDEAFMVCEELLTEEDEEGFEECLDEMLFWCDEEDNDDYDEDWDYDDEYSCEDEAFIACEELLTEEDEEGFEVCLDEMLSWCNEEDDEDWDYDEDYNCEDEAFMVCEELLTEEDEEGFEECLDEMLSWCDEGDYDEEDYDYNCEDEVLMECEELLTEEDEGAFEACLEEMLSWCDEGDYDEEDCDDDEDCYEDDYSCEDEAFMVCEELLVGSETEEEFENCLTELLAECDEVPEDNPAEECWELAEESCDPILEIEAEEELVGEMYFYCIEQIEEVCEI